MVPVREQNPTESEQDEVDLRKEFPVIPLRDSVLFPHSTSPFTVARTSSTRLVASLHESDKLVVLVAQRDPTTEEPGLADLHPVGTLGRLLHTLPLRQAQPIEPGNYILVIQGLRRVRLLEQTQRQPFLMSRIEPLQDVVPSQPDAEYTALRDAVRNTFTEIIEMSPVLSNDLLPIVAGTDDAGTLTDFAAAALPALPTSNRQRLLETLDVRERMKQLMEDLLRERESLLLQLKIRSEVREKISGTQREMLLREQLKAIQKELGELDQEAAVVEQLRKKIEDAGMPEEPKAEALRELGRLSQIPPAAAEYTVSRTYLEWLAALPWTKSTAQPVDVRRAQQILDEDHYDLQKVKERILEYLSVLQLKRDLKGPILCFTGPPGVGKTSLGKSIARALGRRFVRISLGGMQDEAEIRGHRRTYVGALPGQILQGVRRAGSNDPIFMLDEIDKLGKDFRGDPAAALLEVLDPEQNFAFRDHYLDVPFDLSRILFITTANILEPVPPALLDRMEVLELAGYTDEEKLHIARQFLVPKEATANALEPGVHIQFTDEGLREIVGGYTHEAGVRNLGREIATLCRKHARRIAADGVGLLTVTPEVVQKMLGPRRFRVETELVERTRIPGVAVALAWTPHGGDVLFVEATRMDRGLGELTITGQVGPVMQESMKTALSWFRANARRYDVDPADFKKFDMHIHVPAGAIPKDGPSAGLVIAVALASLFTGRTTRPYLALTGEVTLTGHVLPIGGLKEKVLAAKRSGVREIILPRINEPNLAADVPAEIRTGLAFHFVDRVDEAIVASLEPVGAHEAAALGRAFPG